MVQYDGTDFFGWAEQKELRTVHRTLKEYIYRISGEEVELRGASRTDSGAHALGQVADFATEYGMPAEKWAQVINRWSAPEIRIADSRQVAMKFHSRFYARSRIYEYRMSELDAVEPTRSRYVHSAGCEMNLLKMQQASVALIGRHDFRAFGADLVNVENADREIYQVKLKRTGDEIRITIEGTAFLKGMMRRIAGGLFEVGRGKRKPSEIGELLDLNKREDLVGPVVLPASGLTLKKVKFGRHLRDLRDEDS